MLNQLKVRSRLVLLAALPLTALVLMCLLSLYDMKLLATGVDSLYNDRVKPLQQIKQVSDAYAVTIVDTLHKHRAGLLDASQTLQILQQAEGDAEKAWQAYRVTQMTDEEQRLLEIAERDITHWSAQLAQYRRLLADNQLTQEPVKSFNETLYASADPLSASLTKLIDLQLNESGRFTAEAQHTLDSTVWLFVSLVLLVGLVLLLLSVLVTRSIQRPLSNLQTTIVAVGTNSDLRLRATVTGRDEIADTALAFNQTIGRMQQFFSDLSNAVVQLAAASEEMSTISHQVSKTAFEQEQQANLIATAINQMSAAIQEVANSAQNTSDQANQTDVQAQQGVQQVTANITAITRLSETVNGASAVIGQLSTESDKISQVLSVIQSIAAQTNLLALNAAIEAARAGEAGRGFAVVADEVRTLATNTQQATESIRSMIDTLQAAARDAVNAMAQSQGHADGSVHNAQQAGTLLEQIKNSISSIVDMNVQISTATEQQTIVAEEINRNITDFNSSICEVSRSSAQSAEASETLAELASRLRLQAAAFQV
ncbi:MAG: methyl-accepting chemotaxis protein [Rheinheimera sp.]|nr:methyl-accepting chemotaxis protein [Rheinheimera sp.]